MWYSIGSPLRNVQIDFQGRVPRPEYVIYLGPREPMAESLGSFRYTI